MRVGLRTNCRLAREHSVKIAPAEAADLSYQPHPSCRTAAHPPAIDNESLIHDNAAYCIVDFLNPLDVVGTHLSCPISSVPVVFQIPASTKTVPVDLEKPPIVAPVSFTRPPAEI